MPDIFGLLSLPNLTDEDFDFIAEVLVESESVSKHEGGGHDQKAHGNWAKGRAEEYQGQHTPPEDAAPLHDLLAEGTWFPDDVYTHPQFYVHGDDDVVAESLAAIREARGKPDALITVYRSVPPGVTSINTGDWVSLSRAYAENHGAERDREYWDADREWTIEGPTPETSVSGVGQWVSYDEPRDWPVVEAKVPARLILNGGNDLIEWGYWGPDVEDGEAISKHADHDQKTHGNWATGEQASEVHQLKNRTEGDQMVALALLERGRRYSDLERIRPNQVGRWLQGGALIEELTGAKPEEVSLVADGIMGVAQNVGVAFFREQSYDLIREEIVKVDALLGELSGLSGLIDVEPDLVKEITNKVIPSLKKVRKQLQSHLVGSQLLAENVDLDLLTTPPPDGKMTSWADSVADNPDGGAGFLEGVRRLAATPIGYSRDGTYTGGPQEAKALMNVVVGELLSAHIRKATSEVSEVRLDSRVSELDFTKPFADQQERPLSDLEFSDPLFDLLPPSTLTKIGSIMDVAIAGVGSAPIRDIDRGSWKRDLDDPNIARAVKHSVNGRIAERIYAASGDRTIVGIGLVDVYDRVNSQTEAWAKSSASEYSAQLQQSVSRMVGREDSFDSFAERQNFVGLLGTAFTDVYARAIYAETQALLALSPETSLKAARGTKLKLSPEFDLPVKVVEKAIEPMSGSQRTLLSHSMWEVSTDTIGRQPLSSWSTSTQVAHSFADLNSDMDGALPYLGGFSMVQRAVIPDSQIFSTALTGPGCLGEQEIIAIEGTRGTTNVSVVYNGAGPDRALSNAQARDADGDGWIYEGTDREQFVGKADKKFEYDREVPEQSREGIVSLLTWIPDNWDAAYLIDEPSET